MKRLNNQGAEYNNPVIESTKPAVYEITIRYAIPVYVVTAFGYGIITPFKKEDSELQFWTRSKDPDKNKDTLIQLYNCVFLQGYDKAHDL
ncbi:unnamed protein product [Rhizophagus irregularis]|nr:unnamed protein product [Rhizophagus irregularis]